MESHDAHVVNKVLACIIDIATALIPAFLLWDLQMKRTTKAVLHSVFGLGLLVAALSIGRAASSKPDTWDVDPTCMFI